MHAASKFKLGDVVSDVDGSRRGVVSFIGAYDDHLGQHRYKVKEEGGKRHYWNESSMVLVGRKMTLAQARAKLRPAGMVLRKEAGEYRVSFRGPSSATEDSAYYTDNLGDAVQTGLAMAERRG